MIIENYTKLADGHWYQKTLTDSIPDYNVDYSAIYDTYFLTDELSKLRYDNIVQTIGEFNSICDFGYGNGSFLNYCYSKNKKCFGYDISGYPLQQGIQQINEQQLNSQEFDVLTFFDSIEHIQNSDLLSFLNNKKAQHFCISVPWFHEQLGQDWFCNWKHRRENEHLHHFDSSGLIKLLVDCGCQIKYVGNYEDKIRVPVSNYPNILTVIASKKYK